MGTSSGYGQTGADRQPADARDRRAMDDGPTADVATASGERGLRSVGWGCNGGRWISRRARCVVGTRWPTPRIRRTTEPSGPLAHMNTFLGCKRSPGIVLGPTMLAIDSGRTPCTPCLALSRDKRPVPARRTTRQSAEGGGDQVVCGSKTSPHTTWSRSRQTAPVAPESISLLRWGGGAFACRVPTFGGR